MNWIKRNEREKEERGEGSNRIKRDEREELERDELTKEGWRRGMWEEWIEYRGMRERESTRRGMNWVNRNWKREK